jgi:hypothetical protein
LIVRLVIFIRKELEMRWQYDTSHYLLRCNLVSQRRPLNQQCILVGTTIEEAFRYMETAKTKQLAHEALVRIGLHTRRRTLFCRRIPRTLSFFLQSISSSLVRLAGGAGFFAKALVTVFKPLGFSVATGLVLQRTGSTLRSTRTTMLTNTSTGTSRKRLW